MIIKRLIPKEINEALSKLRGLFASICYDYSDSRFIVYHCYVINLVTNKEYHLIDLFSLFLCCPQLKQRQMNELITLFASKDKLNDCANELQALITPMRQADGTIKSRYSMIEISEYLIRRCLGQKSPMIDIVNFQRHVNNHFADERNKININNQTQKFSIPDVSIKSLNKTKFVPLFKSTEEVINKDEMKDLVLCIEDDIHRIKKRTLKREIYRGR